MVSLLQQYILCRSGGKQVTGVIHTAQGDLMVDLLQRDPSRFNISRKIRLGPRIKIRPTQIVFRHDQFPTIAPPVDRHIWSSRALGDSPLSALPFLIKGLTKIIDLNGTVPFLTTKIMNAIHQSIPCAESLRARSVPIIELRVTIFANAASSKASDPAGRCGNTR